MNINMEGAGPVSQMMALVASGVWTGEFDTKPLASRIQNMEGIAIAVATFLSKVTRL